MKHLPLFLIFLFINLYSKANSHYFFNQITVKEGLASNNVYAVWQDKMGYIWLGTDNGLQRYDGKYFLYFEVKKPVPLPAKPVRQILEDREGNVWLRYGDDYGIFNPEDLSFYCIPFEKPEDMHRGEKLWMDSRGNIYVILRRNKLLYYDQEKGVFSEENLPIQIPAGYHPNAIFEDTKTGYFWISCEEGLAVFDFFARKTYHKGNNPLHLPFLDDPKLLQLADYFIDKSRNHWLVYWNPHERFGSYNEKSGKYSSGAATLETISLDYREMNGSFESRTGDFWYFGVNSLYIYQPSDNDFVPIAQPSLKFEQVYQMFEDREGSLWLGTDQGVFHYTGKSPEVVYAFFKEGDPQHQILEIKEIFLMNNQRVFWMPSWGRGIIILDQHFKELPSEKIYENASKNIETYQTWDLIQERSTGLVWVGTQKGGLQIINPNTLQARFYSFPIFRQSTIRSLVEDLNGNIWLTTQRGDLIRYRKEGPLVNASFELVHQFNGLAMELLVDQQNRIWVCTSNAGVFSVDGNSGSILLHLDGSVLSSNKQEKIAQLNDSIFFFGSDLLNAYNVQSGENRVLSYADGLISNNILNMQVDNDGFLWIFTPNGICRYHYYQNAFIQYGQKESFRFMGLDGKGGTVTSEGKIIFTGYQSLTAFDPSQFNGTIKPDRPTLTNIKLFDHLLFVDSLNTEEKRTFSNDKNAFTFYFSTLSFIYQERLKYYYKLSGIDADWQARSDFKYSHFRNIRRDFDLMLHTVYTIGQGSITGIEIKDLSQYLVYGLPS